MTQILADVSTATGVKVEGESGDQRVYGHYGPAPASEVLNELLEGSDYNMMMLGGAGDGAPRQLVLSKKLKLASTGRRGDFARPTPADGGDVDLEQPEPPEPPEPVRRRPFPANPGQMSPVPQLNQQTPQEQQMRLQQLQQQLQQQATPAQLPAPQLPADQSPENEK